MNKPFFFKSAPGTPVSKLAKGHLAIMVANLIFGVNTVLSKSLLTEVLSPLGLTFLRMFGAGALFWTASLFLPSEKVDKKDLSRIFLASLLGIFLNQLLFIIGLSKTSPIEASIVVTLTPILTMLMAAAYLREPITGKKSIGVLIGASGAILLIVVGASNFSGGGSTLGNLLCVCSGISYASYLTFFKPIIQKYSPVTLMKWMFLFSAMVSIPLSYDALTNIDYSQITFFEYLRIAYVVCGATFLAYLLIPIAQKSLRPTTLSMYNYTQPLVASVLAIALGMDSFGWTKVGAGILVFLGVYLVTTSKSRAQIEIQARLKRRKHSKNTTFAK